MPKSKGLFVILVFTLPVGSASAQKILLAGVQKASDCQFAARPLAADLRAVGFPKDWTIVVACNQNVWRFLQLRGNATLTNTAYTRIENRITVINGMMYWETPPLNGSTQRTPLAVLQHEHGHILCNCNDERKADELGTSYAPRRAEQGDAQAAYLLGDSYMTGTGVPKDDAKAAKWFLESAKQGFPDAEFALGYLYEHGEGVRRNYKRALSYYEAAARQGHPTAQNNLAAMYEDGEGVRKNIDEAEHWYQLAADRGNVVAECNLASLYFRQRHFPQAVTWFRAAAQSRNPTAQQNLAWMYYTGTGTMRDYSEAAKWIRLAAEQAIPRAELDLAYLYEQGKGVPLDYVAAFGWYKAASAGGEKKATERLKSLTQIMTPEQISNAGIAAAQITRTTVHPETTEPIGSSFADSQ